MRRCGDICQVVTGSNTSFSSRLSRGVEKPLHAQRTFAWRGMLKHGGYSLRFEEFVLQFKGGGEKVAVQSDRPGVRDVN